jgi:hypothetical protein
MDDLHIAQISNLKMAAVTCLGLTTIMITKTNSSRKKHLMIEALKLSSAFPAFQIFFKVNLYIEGFYTTCIQLFLIQKIIMCFIVTYSNA